MLFQKAKFKRIDEAKIETAIADFENSVDFELVPVISERSSYIEHITWILSLVLTAVFISILDYYLQNSWSSRTVYYLAAVTIAVILGHYIDKSDIVDRFFISKRERQRQVLEKAQRIFFLKRLHETRSHHALLLYVSIMERQIVILPDPSMKLEGLTLLQEKLLKIVQTGFKSGQYEKGFLDAIQFLKTELALKFPQTNKDHTNLVSNKLIWWNV